MWMFIDGKCASGVWRHVDRKGVGVGLQRALCSPTLHDVFK